MSLILPTLLFAVAAYHDYDEVVDGTTKEINATTSALAEHAKTVLETDTLVLARVLDRVDDKSWDEIRNSEDIHKFLAGLKQDLPQVQAIYLVDPEGLAAASSRGFPAQQLTAVDRDYFHAARSGQGGIFVSTSFRSPVTGELVFTVSRARITAGRFNGLAALTVAPSYFDRFYREVAELPASSVAGLIRDDGIILVHYPVLTKPAPPTEPNSPFWQAAMQTGGSTFSGRSPLDGRMKMIGLRRVADWPLVVSYAIDQNAYLSQWHRHLAIYAAFSILVGVVPFFASRIALHRTRQERASTARVIEEIARREQAERMVQQMQKMDALGRLTGGIAHDFNNLLTAVTLSIDLALSRTTDEAMQRLLSRGTEAAQRGAKLTRQMLMFARRQALTMQSVDVNALVSGMKELMQRTIGTFVQIAFEPNPDTWPAVADPSQLEMAILNLAINARDAMPRGGDLAIVLRNIEFAADCAPVDISPGPYLEIAVIDTGIGMSEDVRINAFEPFFTTKEVGKGTGLGLSMVYGFARQAGGTATIESSIGAGTTVRIYLPRAVTMPTDDAVTAPAIRRAGPTYRILLVDDDEAVRGLAAEMLRGAGHQVIEASDGFAATEYLESDLPFDLMFLDLAMPGLNGGDVAAVANELRPELPVVFMTGYAETDLLQPWIAKGYRVVAKPFRSADFDQILIELFETPNTFAGSERPGPERRRLP